MTEWEDGDSCRESRCDERGEAERGGYCKPHQPMDAEPVLPKPLTTDRWPLDIAARPSPDILRRVIEEDDGPDDLNGWWKAVVLALLDDHDDLTQLRGHSCIEAAVRAGIKIGQEQMLERVLGELLEWSHVEFIEDREAKQAVVGDLLSELENWDPR